MEQVLIKKDGRWVMTHLSAYQRNKNTSLPLDDFLKFIGWLDEGLKDVEEILDHDRESN